MVAPEGESGTGKIMLLRAVAGLIPYVGQVVDQGLRKPPTFPEWRRGHKAYEAEAQSGHTK